LISSSKDQEKPYSLDPHMQQRELGIFCMDPLRTKRDNPQDSNEVIVEFSSAVPWLQRFLVLEASSSSLI
jgi:hypothetical protein